MPGTEAAIRFVNISHTPCTLRGWPRVQALESSGTRILVKVIDDHTTGAWGPYPSIRVPLQPNGVAFSSLLIGTSVAAQDDRACRGVRAWRISEPGDDHPVTTSARGGVWPQLCPQKTEIEVSPIHPPPAA